MSYPTENFVCENLFCMRAYNFTKTVLTFAIKLSNNGTFKGQKQQDKKNRFTRITYRSSAKIQLCFLQC